MAKIYDVVAAIGEYTGPDGQPKTRWANCGSIIKTSNGKTKLKLDTVPIGTEGWFELVKPKQRQVGERQPQQAAPVQSFDDEIPF